MLWKQLLRIFAYDSFLRRKCKSYQIHGTECRFRTLWYVKQAFIQSERSSEIMIHFLFGFKWIALKKYFNSWKARESSVICARCNGLAGWDRGLLACAEGLSTGESNVYAYRAKYSLNIAYPCLCKVSQNVCSGQGRILRLAWWIRRLNFPVRDCDDMVWLCGICNVNRRPYHPIRRHRSFPMP